MMGGKRQSVELANEVKTQPWPASTRTVRIAFGLGKRMVFSETDLLKDRAGPRPDAARHQQRRLRVAILRRECTRRRIRDRNWCHRLTTRLVRSFGGVPTTSQASSNTQP